MFKTFYEFENKNIITNDKVSEYCMAEHLNEDYFRFNMKKEVKSHSVVRNMMAAVLTILSNLFKQ